VQRKRTVTTGTGSRGACVARSSKDFWLEDGCGKTAGGVRWWCPVLLDSEVFILRRGRFGSVKKVIDWSCETLERKNLKVILGEKQLSPPKETF